MATLDTVETHARRPEGSSFTYGLIGVVLAALALVIFGMFYRLEVLAHPVLVALGLTVSFVLGVLLRKRRKRLHGLALKQALRLQEDMPPSE